MSRQLTPEQKEALCTLARTNYFPKQTVTRTIKSLERMGFIKHDTLGWQLTAAGKRHTQPSNP